jgi:thiosulfate dehydrogenase [quinone] large subunit
VDNLFNNTEYAWIWLIARVYIGWGWLHAGWEKVNSDGWMAGGTSLQGYWTRAVAVPETGRPAITYDWYRDFLQLLLDANTYTWFAKLVAIGELAVGIALLLGIFTGIAAFFGAFMNWNFMLAGTASTNPIMGILGIGVMVAWKTAGWWGLDRFVLPYLGVPWARGPLLGGRQLRLRGWETPSRGQLVEQWIRILIGVALALYAFVGLSGLVELLVLALAGVIVAVSGLGLFPLWPKRN